MTTQHTPDLTPDPDELDDEGLAALYELEAVIPDRPPPRVVRAAPRDGGDPQTLSRTSKSTTYTREATMNRDPGKPPVYDAPPPVDDDALPEDLRSRGADERSFLPAGVDPGPPEHDDAPPPDDDAGEAPERPLVILVASDQRTTRQLIEAQLARHNRVKIYRQIGSDRLVTVAEDAEGRPTIRHLDAPRLSELVTDVCVPCVMKRDREGNEVATPCAPSKYLLDGLAAAPPEDTPWSRLAGIITSPTMRPDGTILDAPGYDPSTALIYAPDAAYPPIPDRPTRADAAAALGRLLDLLCDFPFGAEHHRAGALAAIMTPVLRAAIAGPTPIFAVDATTPGSGKGLLVSLAAIAVTGRTAELASMPPEEELAKCIVADLVAGRPIGVLDNITAPLKSNVLCAYATARHYKGRILGSTKILALLARMVLYLTGNNLLVLGDLRRRVVRIYLAPDCEKPETRTGFRHADLERYVCEHRAAIVADVLTIARAYITDGRKLAGKLPKTGSYGDWASVVREPLVWLDLVDPWAGSQAELDGDPQLDDRRDLLAAIHAEHGPAPWTAKDLLETQGGTEARDTIKRVVAELTEGHRALTEGHRARALAGALRPLDGRILGNHRLRKLVGNRGNRGQRWSVESIGVDARAGDPKWAATGFDPHWDPRQGYAE